MKQIITHSELILFLYDETDFLQKAYIQKELTKNEDLQQQLNDLMEAHETLKITEMEPSEHSINNILNYSQCSALGE